MEKGKSKWIGDIFVFDNLKFVAIYCVCFNHLYYDATCRYTTYVTNAVVAFAIPLFAFASGYSQKNLKSTGFFSKTLSVYLAANLIYIPWYLYYGPKHHHPPSLLFLAIGPTAQVLWYFLALIAWKMVTPFVVQFRMPLLFSVIISIVLYSVSESLISAQNGAENYVYTMTLREIIRDYPFYLAGVIATRDHIFQLRNSKFKYLLLAPAAAGIYLCGSGRVPNTPESNSLLQCVIYMLIAFCCSAALISIIPGKSFKFFTPLGQKTMGIYLFHSIVLRLIIKLLIAPMLTPRSPLYNSIAETFVFALVAYAACILAARPILMTYFNKFSRLIETSLFNPEFQDSLHKPRL